MARILAIDTTTEFGSLALVEGGRVLEEELVHAADGFGHVLWERVERLLARHGWRTEQVDCFAAAAGPGSFTGVRVGLAAVKGLAEAHGKPVAGVSNMAALAWFGTAPLRAVVVDARRGEVYGAVYNAALEVVAPEVVTRFREWLEGLPEGEMEFVSSEFWPFRAALAGTRFSSAPVREAPRALAGAIGLIAVDRLAGGRAQDPADLDANYVRRSDAERFWEDQNPGRR